MFNSKGSRLGLPADHCEVNNEQAWRRHRSICHSLHMSGWSYKRLQEALLRTVRVTKVSRSILFLTKFDFSWVILVMSYFEVPFLRRDVSLDPKVEVDGKNLLAWFCFPWVYSWKIILREWNRRVWGREARLWEREMLRDPGVQIILSGRMRMPRSTLEPGKTSESKIK